MRAQRAGPGHASDWLSLANAGLSVTEGFAKAKGFAAAKVHRGYFTHESAVAGLELWFRYATIRCPGAHPGVLLVCQLPPYRISRLNAKILEQHVRSDAALIGFVR